MRRHLCMLSLAILVFALAGCFSDEPASPVDVTGVTTPDTPGSEAIWIGPIEGLTTRWHPIPANAAVPQGTTVEFRINTDPDAIVTWNGAEETSRDGGISVAMCPTESPGPLFVSVVITPATTGGDGRGNGDPLGVSSRHEATINVVGIPVDQITVGRGHVSSEPVRLGENATNMETMKYYFDGSVSQVVEVGSRHYRTAAGTKIKLDVDVSPAEFASMTEWRVGEKAVLLGGSSEYKIKNNPGTRDISVGPSGSDYRIQLDVYEVILDKSEATQEAILRGTPITYRATTNPSGYESEIVWLSSTKYGTATPVMGRGAEFTVTFKDVLGAEGERNGGMQSMFAWTGALASVVPGSHDTFAKSITLVPVGPVVGPADLIVVRLHGPEAGCVPFCGPVNLPGVTTASVICTGTANCDDPGGVLAMAASIAAGLAIGCPGTIAVGATITIPDPGRLIEHCSVENPGPLEIFGVGGCPLELTTLTPVDNVCDGVSCNERAAPVGGISIVTP